MKRMFQFSAVILLGAVAGLSACEQKGGPLKVDRVEPPEGTTAGGDQIAIRGGGFEPGKTQARVTFGRRPAENVVIASPTTINVTTPAGDKGPVDISVMFDSGESFKIPGGFKYVAPATQGDVRKAFMNDVGKKPQ